MNSAVSVEGSSYSISLITICARACGANAAWTTRTSAEASERRSQTEAAGAVMEVDSCGGARGERGDRGPRHFRQTAHAHCRTFADSARRTRDRSVTAGVRATAVAQVLPADRR